MNAALLTTGLALVGLGLTWGQVQATDPAPEPTMSQPSPAVHWRTDLGAAIEEATRTRRPLLAVFR